MTVMEKVLRVLRNANSPLSARAIQGLATEGKDPTARSVRRTIRRLKDRGWPIFTSSTGHLFLRDDMEITLTCLGERAVSDKRKAKPVARAAGLSSSKATSKAYA